MDTKASLFFVGFGVGLGVCFFFDFLPLLDRLDIHMKNAA